MSVMLMIAILSWSAVADEGAGSEECVTDENSLLQMNVQMDHIDEQKKVGTMAQWALGENMARESQVQAELATKVLAAARRALKHTEVWAKLAHKAASKGASQDDDGGANKGASQDDDWGDKN